jgi:PIN domain nuclease of toxin-antitoxin system
MIVLDTHVWIWLVSKPSLLTRKAHAALSREQRFGVSDALCTPPR